MSCQNLAMKHRCPGARLVGTLSMFCDYVCFDNYFDIFAVCVYVILLS
jgi:hypothetical protein